MGEHTPTPWSQFVMDGKCEAIMPSGRAGDICTFRDSPSEDNAAFIIKAVNSHNELVAEVNRLSEMTKLQGQEVAITRDRDDALVKALENTLAWFDGPNFVPKVEGIKIGSIHIGPITQAVIDDAREALAKVRSP